MGGKHSRDKGANFERQIVNTWKAMGLEAKRVPLSGATWMKDDVILEIGGDPLSSIKGPRLKSFELKKRANGFKQLYSWLTDRTYGLIIARDRSEALVVLRLKDFAELVK